MAAEVDNILPEEVSTKQDTIVEADKKNDVAVESKETDAKPKEKSGIKRRIKINGLINTDKTSNKPPREFKIKTCIKGVISVYRYTRFITCMPLLRRTYLCSYLLYHAVAPCIKLYYIYLCTICSLRSVTMCKLYGGSFQLLTRFMYMYMYTTQHTHH